MSFENYHGIMVSVVCRRVESEMMKSIVDQVSFYQDKLLGVSAPKNRVKIERYDEYFAQRRS